MRVCPWETGAAEGTKEKKMEQNTQVWLPQDFSSCRNNWSLGLWPLEGAREQRRLPEGLPGWEQLGRGTAE